MCVKSPTVLKSKAMFPSASTEGWLESTCPCVLYCIFLHDLQAVSSIYYTAF